jgi:hypothetical protein
VGLRCFEHPRSDQIKVVLGAHDAFRGRAAAEGSLYSDCDFYVSEQTSGCGYARYASTNLPESAVLASWPG